MSQVVFDDIVASTKSGTQLAADLNGFKAALLSMHSGVSRPTYAQAGTMWAKEVSGTQVEIYLYDGANDILFATYNPASSELTSLSIPDGSVTDEKLSRGVGTAANNLMALDASGVAPAVSAVNMSNTGRLINHYILTSSGVYTKSAAARRVRVRIQGGGGGGGGSAATGAGQYACGGGGGAGGWAEKYYDASDLNASEVYTVGAAGAGGAAGNNPGGTGGDTTFKGMTATGGQQGGGGSVFPTTATGAANGGSVGGVGTSGDLNGSGGTSYTGLILGGNNAMSGPGGASIYGPGAGTVNNNGGSAAKNYGAGGSGASSTVNQPARAGGAGMAGVIEIWEYA